MIWVSWLSLLYLMRVLTSTLSNPICLKLSLYISIQITSLSSLTLYPLGLRSLSILPWHVCMVNIVHASDSIANSGS